MKKMSEGKYYFLDRANMVIKSSIFLTSKSAASKSQRFTTVRASDQIARFSSSEVRGELQVMDFSPIRSHGVTRNIRA